MDLIYAIGSLNCSGVGLKVGQSARPKGRSFGFEGALRGLGVLTVDKSNVGATEIVGPSRKKTLTPASSSASVRSEDSSWDAAAVSAAMASVLDLRGARLDSMPDGFALSFFAAGLAGSSCSMGMAPSTGMSRQVVKVAAGDRAENSAAGTDCRGLSCRCRDEPPLRAGEPREGGEPRWGEPACMCGMKQAGGCRREHRDLQRPSFVLVGPPHQDV